MITAASNSRIKRLVQLNQKSKLRRTEDVFLAEGVKMFLEAPREQLHRDSCIGSVQQRRQDELRVDLPTGRDCSA